VAAARARAATARAQAAEVEVQLKRERALAEKGATATSAVEDLDARWKSLGASISAADADVRAALAEVETLKVNLTYTQVYAPIDGRVIEKPIEVGDSVSPMVASTLVSLADFSTLVVETDVPEGRLGQVKLGSPCEIQLDAFPGKRFRGQAVEIASKVDRSKATVGVKVKFVDDNTGVLPDMAARVSFLGKELDEASMKEPPRLVVPGSAVAERNGQKVVFVIDQGKVRQAPIVLGPAFGDGFEVKSGPTAGTKVVNNPAPDLAEGQNVKEKD
jgi:RND family efflux transporter MFP subunit